MIESASFARLWQSYRQSARKGSIMSLRELGLTTLGGRARLGFANPHGAREANHALSQLLTRFAALGDWAKGLEMAHDLDDEQRVFALGLQWLEAAEVGHIEHIRELIDSGFPVNFQHPETKDTALHRAAGCNLEGIVDLLLAHPDIDVLIRDERGKTAWDNARFFTLNDAMADRLLERIRVQAESEGLDFWSDHQKWMREWFKAPWFAALDQPLGAEPD